MNNLFAEKLTELLEEKNISKRECARQTNISAQSISDWSTGKILPTAENIFILAKFFNVSADFLLGLEEERSYGKITEKKDEIPYKEKKLLKAFSVLQEDEKDKIIADCEYFANKHTKRQKEKA